VRHTGRRYTRWKADAPLGSSVEWEAETTVFEPDHRIAWRSVRGDVDTEGEVIFEETRRGTTLMRVVLGYDPPAGRLGSLVASLFGKNPEQQLEEDLRRFADAVEGRRKEVRRAAYDERGWRGPRAPAWEDRQEGRRDRNDHAEDAPGGYMHGDDARGVRRKDGYRDSGYRTRAYQEDDERHERESRSRFDEALREARRSQLEGQRRYRQERERDEQRRYREDRAYEPDRRYVDDERSFAAGERMRDERRRDDLDGARREARMSEPPGGRVDEGGRRRPGRHPMTPREWEQEQARRQPDHEYSKEAFRRGVDKLMDEPPSRRWRRWD
jgi:hypothetical protein